MLPELVFAPDPNWLVPDEAECVRLWTKYGMLPHIQNHCRAVASVAMDIARKARARGYALPEREILAAALLHDIAKTYTIHHGGGHAQLGAAWVREETGNPVLAQAVLFHVIWPWDNGLLAPQFEPLRTPLIVSYADKRTRHDEVVSLKDRFADLLDRYGDTEEHRRSIRKNQVQAQVHEQALFALLGPL